MNSCPKKINLKDIDEKFWKTVEYERRLYEAGKPQESKPTEPNK